MNWSDLEWPVLDRLRERFLRGSAATGPYWQTEDDLAVYDLTFGERIGWKWDHVLRELRLRHWRPESRHVVDWGCGSGVAGRRVLSFFGPENFASLAVWDHSPVACDFAATAARKAFPSLNVAQATPGFLAGSERIGLLVVSHVINELPAAERDRFRLLAAQADEILWVEPGTYDDSRQLGTMREQLRAAGFHVVAPCTRQLECPMFALGNERHWCHFFAPPPGEIFADSDWVKFGQRAGIDLRSLPYCFIALARQLPAPGTGGAAHDAANPTSEPLSRVIGRPEHFKPYARILNCDVNGLEYLEVPKRSAPALYKELDRTKAPLVYRWQRDGNKIIGGTAAEKP